MKPQFFPSPAAFRRWLGGNHAKVRELLVGFYKKDSGKGGLTYKEGVDEALCFGWIDGVRRRWDETRYTIRFTPRKARSIWSAVNRKRARELEAQGLMAAAGLAAFHGRDKRKQNQYSFENRGRGLDPVYQKTFRANRPAWAYFQAQPPWYQRTSSWWVISAKQETTRARRLAALIEQSAMEEWIGPLKRK